MFNRFEISRLVSNPHHTTPPGGTGKRQMAVQWCSQGEGAVKAIAPPVGLDSDKIIVGLVVHVAELN